MAGSVSTRGHPLKLFKPQLLRDVKSHAFSQQVINDWNKLDSDIVTTPTLSILKDCMISVVVTTIVSNILCDQECNRLCLNFSCK